MLRRAPSTIVLLIGTCFFAAVSFGGLVSYVLWDTRKDRVERAATANRNLAQVLAGEIRRTFELYDLSLHGAIEGLAYPDLDNLPPAGRQQFLFDRASTATYMNAILVFDAYGDIRYDSTTVTPRRLNAADQEYFRVHRADSHAGLYISKPIKSRLSGDWVVLLSRRYALPDGSFGGVVVGSLALEYFSSLFDRLSISDQGAVSIFRGNGTLLMRRPYRFDLVGKDLSHTTLFSHYPARRSGSFSSMGLDGVPREFAFSAVANLPLVLSVGSTQGDILGDWPQKATLMAVASVIFCSVLAFLMGVLINVLAKRDLLEQELFSAALRDPLTRIGNRRAFTERLATEWRDSIRRDEPLSLLIIDVDLFKAFNDNLGHVAGDLALQTVAMCIEGQCRRPHDFAARYGGEEFAAILPNTDYTGAIELAECIRLAVRDARISHPAAPDGYLTISVGIACREVEADTDNELIKRADAALYEAKKNGRNCVAMMPILKAAHFRAIAAE